MRPLICIVCTYAFVHCAAAQVEGPGWRALDHQQEFSLAKSAATASVSEQASIWMLNGETGRYEKVVDGPNGNNCIVMRSFPASLEPLCYDAEASRTILPIEIRRFELRSAGCSWNDIDRMIDEEIKAGSLFVPERPAMAYMLSSGQELYADDGRNVGNWKPHLMLYIPYVTNEAIGLAGGETAELMVIDPGTALACVIMVQPSFVDPEDSSRD